MFQVCSITVEDQEHFRDEYHSWHLLGKRSDIRFGSLEVIIREFSFSGNVIQSMVICNHAVSCSSMMTLL